MSNIIKKFDLFQSTNEEVFSSLTSKIGKLAGKAKNLVTGKSNKAFQIKTDDNSMGKKILTVAKNINAGPNISNPLERIHSPANNWYYFFTEIDGVEYRVDSVKHIAHSGSSEEEYTVSINKYSEKDKKPPAGDGPNPPAGDGPNPGRGEDPNPGKGEDPNPGRGEDPNPGSNPEPNKESVDGSIYPIMIKNLTALRDLLRNHVYIKVGETIEFDKEAFAEKRQPENKQESESDNKKEKTPELETSNYQLSIYVDRILKVTSKEEITSNDIKKLSKDLIIMLDEEESNMSSELLEEIKNLRNKLKKVQAIIDDESTTRPEREQAIKRRNAILDRIKNLINKNKSDLLPLGESPNEDTQEIGQTNNKESKINDEYSKLISNWKKQQQKEGKSNLRPGEGTRKMLKKKAAELVEYSELLSNWKKQQQKEGKSNLRPGEGTRKMLKKRAAEIVSASNESLKFTHIDNYLSFCLNEKNRFTKGNKSTIYNAEDYLKQSFIKIRKSIQILEDSKDKGISIDANFVDEILKEKMTSKEDIKKLFDEIYEHLYGKYSKTMPEKDKLYKELVESVSIMVKNKKIVAEKMARFAQRSMQFEGEGFYSGLAVFGDNLETYNETLKKIMDYVKKKNETKNESMILEKYKGTKLNISKSIAKSIFQQLEKKYKLMNPKY